METKDVIVEKLLKPNEAGEYKIQISAPMKYGNQAGEKSHVKPPRAMDTAVINPPVDVVKAASNLVGVPEKKEEPLKDKKSKEDEAWAEEPKTCWIWTDLLGA